MISEELEVMKNEILSELLNSNKDDKDYLKPKYHDDQFWAASRSGMKVIDAYKEVIMNVLDKNTMDKSNFGKQLNLYMSAEKKNGKVVALEFEDDGSAPFYTVQDFMDKVIMHGVKNKSGENSLNGEAGVGAKDGAVFLGGNITFSWSHGNGAEFSVNFIRQGWTGRATESINNYYEGPSYFKLRIEDLNMEVIPPASMRPALSRVFSSALKNHSNVNIYTCRKENVNDNNPPLSPSPAEELDPNFDSWSGAITWHGMPITVRVGKLIEEGKPNPTIVVSRHGVRYVDGYHKDISNAIFVGQNGKSLAATHHLRGIYIDIDCQAVEATQIKNDIQWDSSDTNRSLVAAVANNEDVQRVWKSITQQHIGSDDNKTTDRVLPAAVKDKINMLQDRGAIDLNEVIRSSNITDMFIEENADSSSNTPTRNYTRRATKTPNNTKMKNNNSKDNNLVKIKGKNKPFEIVEIDNCDDERKETRGWLDSREDKIYLMVNKSYAGYTPEIEKDETNKLPLYIAETMGYVFYMYRQNLLAESGKFTADSLKELNVNYEKDTAEYIKIMTTRRNPRK
tara:strand:+ start:1619 stop:3316 length:1698 start_codon:yes stop_codon:yes gene_type:complete